MKPGLSRLRAPLDTGNSGDSGPLGLQPGQRPTRPPRGGRFTPTPSDRALPFVQRETLPTHKVLVL